MVNKNNLVLKGQLLAQCTDIIKFNGNFKSKDYLNGSYLTLNVCAAAHLNELIKHIYNTIKELVDGKLKYRSRTLTNIFQGN